jgi:predicted HTH domain antitoxin
MPTISARLPDEEKEELEEVADLIGTDRSATIRKALREGLQTLRIRVAVERYQTGEVSSLEAARLADVSVAEWFELARTHNLTTQLTVEDLERDVDGAREL